MIQPFCQVLYNVKCHLTVEAPKRHKAGACPGNLSRALSPTHAGHPQVKLKKGPSFILTWCTPWPLRSPTARFEKGCQLTTDKAEEYVSECRH